MLVSPPSFTLQPSYPYPATCIPQGATWGDRNFGQKISNKDSDFWFRVAL